MKNALGDYREIITSSAANQRSEFSIITYVNILIINKGRPFSAKSTLGARIEILPQLME